MGWQPSDMHIYRGESLQLLQTPRHVARKRRGKALLLPALRASAGQSAGVRLQFVSVIYHSGMLLNSLHCYMRF